MGKRKIGELKNMPEKVLKKRLSDADHIEICKEVISIVERMMARSVKAQKERDANR